ncbi:MAG TPA: hypothetical protein VF111_15205, partial [Thermoanaerobaculia bacterium]
MHRFADFVHELQQLERSSLAAQGPLILDVFSRHTPFHLGALYLRDGRANQMRLAAKSQQCVAPEILTGATIPENAVQPVPVVIVPLQSQREAVGLLALGNAGGDGATEEDLALVRAGAAFLSTILTNQRLLQETKSGDFLLKQRLLELESLYDIGLSIASTLNVDELADEILFRMISLTNARRAALYLKEGEGFRLYREFGDVRDGFLDRELASQLMKEGTPLAFDGGSECLFPDCTAFVAVPIKGG